MKIGIVTPTYRKLDGSTYNHLKKTLESVKNQIHQDYKMFLIGDNYSDNDELIELSKIIPSDKIHVENLSLAVERTKYNGRDLWCCGGRTATITGVTMALDDGYDYICRLDHDDIFLEKHLQLISECIEKTGTNFVATKCGNLPDITPTGVYTNYRPIDSRLYKVSVCLNQRYFNMFSREESELKRIYGSIHPGDADLWNRIKAFMIDKNEYGIFINETTCIKVGEGETIKNPKIVK